MKRLSSCCKTNFFWRPMYDKGRKLVPFCKKCEKQCDIIEVLTEGS